MKNRKELKRVDPLTHKLGLTTEPPGDLKIYINESLTKRNKHLFKLVRDVKNEKDWKFAWTKTGTSLQEKTRIQRPL